MGIRYSAVVFKNVLLVVVIALQKDIRYSVWSYSVCHLPSCNCHSRWHKMQYSDTQTQWILSCNYPSSGHKMQFGVQICSVVSVVIVIKNDTRYSLNLFVTISEIVVIAIKNGIRCSVRVAVGTLQKL